MEEKRGRRRKRYLRSGGTKGGDRGGGVDAEIVFARDLHDMLDTTHVQLDRPIIRGDRQKEDERGKEKEMEDDEEGRREEKREKKS